MTKEQDISELNYPPEEKPATKKGIPLPWVFLTALAILVVGAIAYIGPLNILSNIVIGATEDTAYSPGYSERVFQKITIGDTEASVRSSLGAPLSEWEAGPYVRWLYAPDPVPGFEEGGKYPDLRFSFTTIDFGEDGTFTDALGQLSHGTKTSLLGVSASATILADGGNTLSLTNAAIETLKKKKATPEQLEAKFGKPRSVFESRAAKWLQYSHSPGSKNYRQRLIGIDRSGKICRKIDSVWWD